MIITKDFDEEIMDERTISLLKERNSVVKTIKMTCPMCPEQYDCFNKNGKQIAYIRYRFGHFTVDCPDVIGRNVLCKNVGGSMDGSFNSENRASNLNEALDAIDKYYSLGNIFKRNITDRVNIMRYKTIIKNMKRSTERLRKKGR